MIKLIRANIYRMFKSKTLYFFLVIIAIICFVVVRIAITDLGEFQTDFTGDVKTEYLTNLLIGEDIKFEIRGVGTVIIEYTVLLIIICASYTSIFCGQFFDEGTVRNMLATGHSKTSVYMSAFIMNVISSAIFFVVTFSLIGIYILIFGGKPLIWWPYVLIMIGVMYLLTLVITSLVLFLIFTTRKIHIAIIGALLITVILAMAPGLALSDQEAMDYLFNVDFFSMEDYMTSKADGISVYFDDINYKEKFVKGGKVINGDKTINDLPLASRGKIYIAKCSPLSAFAEYNLYEMNPYTMTEGLSSARYTAVSVIWITASTLAGVLLFRKKDII